MPVCKKCNRYLLKESPSGYCRICERDIAQENEKQKRREEEEMKRRAAEEKNEASREFAAIVGNIKAALTGDKEKDILFLEEQMEKYKGHKMGQDIILECARMKTLYLPKKSAAEMERIKQVLNEKKPYELVLEDVRRKMLEKKYNEALVPMEKLIHAINTMGVIKENPLGEYHCFNEVFEELLYALNANPTRELRPALMPYDQIYALYESLLIDLNRPDDAEAALAEAMTWNPSDADIASEHAETFRIKGDMDAFFRNNLKIFRIAFRPKQLARCYRRLGYYFIEKELWEEAVGCYFLSLQFDKESMQARSELNYITQKAGKAIPRPDRQTMEKIARNYGFPFGPDENVLGLAAYLGEKAAGKGAYNRAKYFFQIYYDLIPDPSVKKKLDEMNRRLQCGG